MTYDNLDRLTQTTSTMFGTATYGYNVLDNLTTVHVAGGSKARNHTYVYDPASNRLTNVKNTVDSSTVIGLGYDVQGNLDNKNGVLYDFDFGNRLRTVTDTVGAKTSTYIYDGLGRRVRDTVNGLSKHSHYLQNGQLSMVGDSRTNDVTEYVYLGGSLIATRARDVTTNVYTTTYQHTDALGTPIATTGSTGAFIEKSEYEPFGQQVNVVGAAKDGSGYTGHVQDAATGLVQMQQRYYDPLLGRFLSVDPVTANGSTGANFNRYWYANNSPYGFTDPDGRAPRDKGDPPRLPCPTVASCERERQREKNEEREQEKKDLIHQIASTASGGNRQNAQQNSSQQSYNADWFGNVDPMGNPGGGNELGGVAMTTGVLGFTALAGGAVAYETVGGVAGITAGLSYVWKNVRVDGPSAGLAYANGRVVGISWRGSNLNVRLDYAPIPGSKGTPVLHINFGKSGRGQAPHIVIWDPRWYTPNTLK